MNQHNITLDELIKFSSRYVRRKIPYYFVVFNIYLLIFGYYLEYYIPIKSKRELKNYAD